MLEICESKSGSRIIKFGGRLLSSSVNPEMEAQKWVASNWEKIEGSKNLIVLGLGAGHGVLEIKSAFPEKEIMVIERHQEIIDAFPKSYVSGVKIIGGCDTPKLAENIDLQNFILLPFSFVQFYPSTIADGGYYNDVREIIIGRREVYFQVQAHHRKLAMRKETSMEFPVTIKNIKKALDFRVIDSREAMLWGILGELVI